MQQIFIVDAKVSLKVKEEGKKEEGKEEEEELRHKLKGRHGGNTTYNNISIWVM